MSTTILNDNPVRTRDLLRFNIAAEGKSFDCDFIEPGIISYKDQGGGIELLRKETIDACLTTALGNPLIDGHTWVTAENRLNLEHGVIHEVYFDAADGRYHAKGTVDTDKARALMRVKKPSIGYRVTAFGPPGTYHGIRYDQEITGIEFNHLAIVDKPRYEESTFRLNHSNQTTNMNLFKFLKKIVTRENGADGQSKESVTTEPFETDGNTEVLLEVDGKEVPVRLNELVTAWKAKDAPPAEHKVSGEDTVEIDGQPIRVNELVENFKTTRTNEAAAKKKADDEAAAKAKEDEEAAEKAKRENSAPFFTLRSAAHQPPVEGGYSQSSGSMSDRLKRGKERY